MLFAAQLASAAPLTIDETRVGASNPVIVNVVGPHECISAGQRWGHAPPQHGIVVATGVAANSGSALVRVGDFASRERAFEHYSKHVLGVQLGKNGKAVAKPGGADMPEFGSFAGYQDAARTFMGGGLPEGALQRGRGTDILRVDPSTGYFGVRSSDGTIRTFFRPDGDPVAYFWNQ